MSQESKIIATASKLLDALLLKNPERTALGGVIGFAMHACYSTLKPAFESKIGVTLGDMPWWGALCIGTALVHFPLLLWSISRRPIISEDVDRVIEFIESSNTSVTEKRMAYRRLINKCIDDLQTVRQLPETPTNRDKPILG